MKVQKAGKGMLMPLFGLAGMAKYMQMNKKKRNTVTADPNAVDPVTGQGTKVQKAGLGLMILANQLRKDGKKKGRQQAEEGMKQNKQYQDFLASQNQTKNTATMSMGGMVPTATGSYIKQDIDGDESFTNPSAQEYYKDLLD